MSDKPTTSDRNPKRRKVAKVDEETIDAAARSLGVRLTGMLVSLDGKDHPNGVQHPELPVRDQKVKCSFCGGAGEVEVEIEDFAGSAVIVTIDCPHPPKRRKTRKHG